MINSLGYSFHSKTRKLPKFSHFAEKNVFWSTSEGPRPTHDQLLKTVYLQELVMIFKVAVNNIVNIIHFDQNTVTLELI